MEAEIDERNTPQLLVDFMEDKGWSTKTHIFRRFVTEGLMRPQTLLAQDWVSFMRRYHIDHDGMNMAAAVHILGELERAGAEEIVQNRAYLILCEALRLSALQEAWVHFSRPHSPKDAPYRAAHGRMEVTLSGECHTNHCIPLKSPLFGVTWCVHNLMVFIQWGFPLEGVEVPYIRARKRLDGSSR
jgi:hypothetical protein